MNLFSIPGTDRVAALRALKTIALANGDFAEGERAMLTAAAMAYGSDADLEALEPIAPADLAAAVPDPADRLRVLQACMLMSLADMDESREEVAVLDSFRKAMHVDEPRMATLLSLAAERRRMARFHFMRTAKGGRSQLKGVRFGDVLRTLGVLAPDPERTDKYKALASKPEGTLGREFARYMDKNGFPWRGEKGGMPEAALHHDFTHVLTGYDTDPKGEIEVASFTAGMKKTDPFFFLIFVMLEFHAGLGIRPGQPKFPGNYEPDRAFRAHLRGTRCARDLTDGWDVWADMDRPIEELRSEYGIA